MLWGGNVEPPLWTTVTDPDHLVRWAWSTHATTAGRVVALTAERPELDIIRLTTRAEVEAWVTGPLRDAAVRCRAT